MESDNLERRSAPRYPIPARVVVHRESGAPIPATAVNISSSGMLVCPDQPTPLAIGEAVTVEVELTSHCEKALSAWGIGRVVRVDSGCTAVQLHAGSFCSPASEADREISAV